MKKRDLILHVPVIHRGYLDFFRNNERNIGEIYIIDDEFLLKLTVHKPDIASIDAETVLELLQNLGFQNITILPEEKIEEAKGKPILLINDEISRKLAEDYLEGEDIEWASVFLRRDRSSIITEEPVDEESVTDESHRIWLRDAYGEAEKSSDWWRQAGAVLVKDGEVVLRAYNKGVPSDHTAYQLGDTRDFMGVGESPEHSNTIHAEQKIVAEAARKGISLEGASLYVTHFPCPVCAKLIAYSGIREFYFGEGSSNVEGKPIIASAGVKIRKVTLS